MKLQKNPQKILSRKELVFSGTISLTLIILSKLYNTLITFRVVTEDYAWLAFNMVQMVESIILPTVSFILCDKKRIQLRAILLAVVIFNTSSFLQYLIVYFNPEYYFTTVSIFIAFIIPFLYRYIAESLHPTSDVYVAGSSYIAYKRPSSITGSLCALLTAPYGHCSLIVDNIEFLYRKGVLVERDSEFINNLTFKKIDIVDIKEARKLVGTKWSLKNNCFATFGCFKCNVSI